MASDGGTTPQLGGSTGFWTTVPGMLTAVAGLLSAVGSLILILSGGGTDGGADDSGSGDSGSETTINLVVTPGQAPTDADSVASEVVVTDSVEEGVPGDAENLLDGCEQGDLDACALLLDALVVECAEGYGISCDALYISTPVGSEYEYFGATCGGRFDPEYAGICDQL